MYNIKKRIWESDAEDKELLRWSREAANADRPEAQFVLGSELLAQIKSKETTAEAVALMETSAKGGYPQAMFAMGQMFEYGWGVERDKKAALVWYRRAADKDYKPAHEYFLKRRRRRIVTAAASCLSALTVIGAAFALWWSLSGMAGRLIIHVNKNTDLIEAATLDEFSGELSDLIGSYDDELVISGQVSTNRVILRFEGSYLDLSDFLADKVIARGHNMMVIQFSTEAEAQRCIEELWKLEGIVFAQMDEYTIIGDSISADESTLASPTGALPQNGIMSWGVIDMGLDQLSAYVAKKYPDRSVTVAVIDGGIRSDWSGSGVEDDIVKRILPGYNMVDNSRSIVADAHGTNVGGIILDGTRGTNVNVISFDVFGTNSSSTVALTVNAVDKAIELGVQVINMSMGPRNQTERNYAREDSMKRAYEAGIVFVKAAGNETEEYIETAIPEPIIVGAYDIDHNITSFSNYGSGVDVCAPGYHIYGFLPWNGYINRYTIDTETGGNDNRMNGTSQATPHISALAALLKIMYPDAAPGDIETYIKDYCRTYVNPAAFATGLYGEGAPDATAFIECDSN